MTQQNAKFMLKHIRLGMNAGGYIIPLALNVLPNQGIHGTAFGT